MQQITHTYTNTHAPLLHTRVTELKIPLSETHDYVTYVIKIGIRRKISRLKKSKYLHVYTQGKVRWNVNTHLMWLGLE